MSNDEWKMKSLPLMICAGEASGDAHAATLVRALRDVAPETQFEFFGATGAQMRAAGVDSIVDADHSRSSVVGSRPRLPKFWSAFGELKRAATEEDQTPPFWLIGPTLICVWRAGYIVAVFRSSTTSARNCGPGVHTAPAT